MNQETINEFYENIHMLDTILYALKWQEQNSNYILGIDSVIMSFDKTLKSLKQCCINHIGCPEE